MISPLQRVRATTILGVRRDGKVALGGDGQVSVGETIMKSNAMKVRTLRGGKLLAGFAGAAADAFTLFEKFEGTEEYGRLRHINTFGGHPGACAVAVRNLQIFEDEGLVERSATMGEKLRAGLSPLENHQHVGQIRGKGLLLGIELVEDRKTRQPASAKRMGEVISGCKERGLIVGKNGDTTPGFNNVITLCPPLNITDEDLEFIVGTLKGVLQGSDRGNRPVRPPIA